MSRRDALRVGLAVLGVYFLLTGVVEVAVGTFTLSVLREPRYSDTFTRQRMECAQQSTIRGAADVTVGLLLFLLATWALRRGGKKRPGGSVTPTGSLPAPGWGGEPASAPPTG
jgi:hypothetical protein